MGKVNKAYPTLLGGVSQQAPEQRRPGQHWAQTNMVSDPVRGLVRRPGTLFVGSEDGAEASSVNTTSYNVGSYLVVATSGGGSSLSFSTSTRALNNPSSAGQNGSQSFLAYGQLDRDGGTQVDTTVTLDVLINGVVFASVSENWPAAQDIITLTVQLNRPTNADTILVRISQANANIVAMQVGAYFIGGAQVLSSIVPSKAIVYSDEPEYGVMVNGSGQYYRMNVDFPSTDLWGTVLPTYSAPASPVEDPNTAINSGWKAIDFRVAGKEYALFAPHTDTGLSYSRYAAFCVNKTDNVMVPVLHKQGANVLAADYDADEAARIDSLFSGGISASAAVGRFLFLAGPGMVPAFATDEQYATEDNQSRFVAWVRQGGYSKRYRIALIRGNQKFWVEYTTLSASYPEPLDTSDIVTDDPDYIKKVNDRTNQYNAAVTEWIGRALEDALPTNVAAKLAYELEISGFLGDSATVEVNGSTICITDSTIEEIEVDDGGDNSAIRGIGNTVGAPELLSTLHYPGKVVQIRPNANTDGNVFYLRARAKDQSTGEFTAVTWEECPGTLYTPTQALAWVTVEGGVCYIATRASVMEEMAGIEVNDYVPSECGDADSSPPPEFLTNGITSLGLFQDRLIIGSGPTFFSSRPGDYLNWFRASVLTVAKNDPVSFVAIGGEDDTLRHSVIYDRNLVLFGDKKQYLIDGRKALTPLDASATIMASYPNAADVAPLLIGNFLYYGKSVGDGIATLQQLAPGAIAESPESYEVSAALEDYITGRPWEMRASTSPDAVYFRTDTVKDSIFVYTFLDDAQRQQRQFEAWYKIQFDASLGNIAGISLYDGFLYIGFFRDHGGTPAFVVDRLPLNTDTDRPYLDSQLTYVGPSRGAGYLRANGAPSYSGGSSGDYEGVDIPSEVTLTSPFVRDREDNPVLEGRLTVSTVKVNMKNVGGLTFNVEEPGGLCWGRELRGYVGGLGYPDLTGQYAAPACYTGPEAPAAFAMLQGSADGIQPSQASVDYETMIGTRVALATGWSESYTLWTAPVGYEFAEADFIVTNDGTTDHSARGTSSTSFAVEVQTTGCYVGALALQDYGKNVRYINDLSEAVQEYSYGNLQFDFDPDGQTLPYTPGTPTRGGVLIRAFLGYDGNNMFVEAAGYSQQVNATGDDIEPIPPNLDAFRYEAGSFDIPLSGFEVDEETGRGKFRLEVVLDPEARSLEIWGLDADGARISRVYPDLANAADVALMQGVLDEFLVGGETVAGHVRTRFRTDYFRVFQTGDAACTPVQGPTVRQVSSTDCSTLFPAGMSLADESTQSGFWNDTTPYQETSLVIPIGRETRAYRLTLGPYKWTPLTIANVEWTGQYFNNTRRI